MDAYIDPTNPKKGFNTIQLVESKNKVTHLDIKNAESDWNFLKEFSSKETNQGHFQNQHGLDI